MAVWWITSYPPSRLIFEYFQILNRIPDVVNHLPIKNINYFVSKAIKNGNLIPRNDIRSRNSWTMEIKVPTNIGKKIFSTGFQRLPAGTYFERGLNFWNLRHFFTEELKNFNYFWKIFKKFFLAKNFCILEIKCEFHRCQICGICYFGFCSNF